MISAFDYTDYKQYLRDYTDQSDVGWGIISRLAKVADCQRSHLSRVMNSEVHLTPDQAFAIGKSLRLGPLEFEYFIQMVNLERAGTPSLRTHLSKSLAEIKYRHEDIAQRLNRPKAQLGDEILQLYMSNWAWVAIHILTSIPDFQTIEAISMRLRLQEEKVKAILTQLHELNFVIRKNSRWIFNSGAFHLDKSSPLLINHHQNWRQRALEAQSDPCGQGIHFTAVQSISRRDLERLRSILVNTIEEFQLILEPSKEEELICFTTDLFVV